MLYKYSTKLTQSLSYFGHTLTVSPTSMNDRPKVWQGSKRNYQKFIIFTHQRTGSSLLIGTLRDHPQIVGYGELMLPHRIGFNVTGFDNLSKKHLAFRNKYPTEFLNDYIFTSYPDRVKAVGFKLFPDHIDNVKFRGIWQWLKQNRDIKIIFLTRTNLLARYTSLQLALMTNQFSITDQSQRTSMTIRIDPQACLEDFKLRKRYDEAIKNITKHHEIVNITYEDMTADLNHNLSKFQSFIGVDIQALKVNKVKQQTRPLSEVIENYEELSHYFAKTEWAYIFDE